MPQKVVFAHDTYLLDVGQDELLAGGGLFYEAAKYYLRHFSGVTICCRVRKHTLLPGEKRSAATGPGVRAVAVPTLSGPLAMILNRRKARSALLAELTSADALIARLPSEIGLLAIDAARELGKPYLVEMVACPFDSLWNYGTALGKVYAPVYAARTRWAVKNAPYVVYVTSRFLQRRYPHSSFVKGAVENGSFDSHRVINCSNVTIDKPDDALLLRRRQRIEEISAQRRVWRLGLIGSLTSEAKGVATALAALSMLKDHGVGWEFRHVGVGNTEFSVRRVRELGLEDKVSFDGVLPQSEVGAWLDGIDLYLQPSRQEGLPRALIEAMSRGCPALGSTAGGIPELLDVSCLHPPGDSKKLADLLDNALSNKEWMLAQARRNFEVALNYGRDILNQRRDEFFAGFVRDGAARR